VSGDRELDVVVFGATGFAGRLVAGYLAGQASAGVRADDAGDLRDTTLVVTALRGGISGGTLASLMGQQAEVQASAQLRRVVSDPYALSPDRAAEPDLGDERDPGWARYDRGLRMYPDVGRGPVPGRD